MIPLVGPRTKSNQRENTHEMSLAKDGVWPWERIPMRKILALAQTQPSMKRIVNTTPRPISHQGGPGWTEMRNIISIGVNGGINDITREKALLGDCTIGRKTHIGTIIPSMAGNIMLCASRISVQAAPTAEKMEP